VPVVVSGLSNVRSISAGAWFTCAVLKDGTARCWGWNSYGGLGDGTFSGSNVSVVVSGLSNVRSISAGGSHTCAVLEDGTARCWGYNYYGQLGDGTFMNSNVPVVVSGLSNERSISAGKYVTCAVLEDGTARCWGDNFNGQLGDGTSRFTDKKNLPGVVPGLSNVRNISAGNEHTCAVLEDGTVRCWGSNNFGQLGRGATTGESFVPVVVSGLSNVRSVSTGFYHTCAVLEDGSARCWGYNNKGELGDGTSVTRIVPVVVSGCPPDSSTSNYSECRQVTADGGLLMHSKPCEGATYSLKVTIAKCDRFEYLAAAKPQVSECANQGDFSCWIEVIYKGTRGWIMASTGTSCADDSNPSDMALVAYCPAAACPIRGE
jgi:alpha-tubulin suppressor-like RCC1 family protein